MKGKEKGERRKGKGRDQGSGVRGQATPRHPGRGEGFLIGTRGAGREQGTGPVGFEEAWELVLQHTKPMKSEEVSLEDAPGRTLSRRVTARADSPSADVSLKDGYAVRSLDTAQASKQSPARLRVLGSRFAGERGEAKTRPGACVKVTSGAILPEDADAVVAVEYCTQTPEGIEIPETVSPGLNVLVRGTDSFMRATSLRCQLGSVPSVSVPR